LEKQLREKKGKLERKCGKVKVTARKRKKPAFAMTFRLDALNKIAESFWGQAGGGGRRKGESNCGKNQKIHGALVRIQK